MAAMQALPNVFLGAGRSASAIATGYDHTCVILDDGDETEVLGKDIDVVVRRHGDDGQMHTICFARSYFNVAINFGIM